MKCSRHFLFLFIIFFFASCGRKALITTSDTGGTGGVAALTSGTISLKVSLAWENTPTKFEQIGTTCTASGTSTSYYVPDPSAPPIEPTPCSVNIPEGRLFYSLIKFEVEKPVLDEGCAVVKFRPYYYRKSNSAAEIAPTEPTKPADPGPQPQEGTPPDPNYATKLADWNTKKTAWDIYYGGIGVVGSLAKYKKDLADYNALPDIAKVDCSGSTGTVDKACYGGVGRETPGFPLYAGFSSTEGKITFTSPQVTRLTNDGNRYISNLNNNRGTATLYKYMSNSMKDYMVYCDDIYGNTLAAIKLTISDNDGETPPTDHYCSWVSGSWACLKDPLD